MIIGFDFFQGNCYDGNINSNGIYGISLSNMKVDEIKVDTGTNTQEYNKEKQQWGFNSQLLCDFKDLNFEGGNVNLFGMPIEYLRIKKRKEDELTWNAYKDIPFVLGQDVYNWSDYFVEALVNYSYAIVPVGSQGIEGEYGAKNIDCDYDDIWILGANEQQYHLFGNIQAGERTTVSPSTFLETLGSKYPYEIKNGIINYRKSSLKAMLLNDDFKNNDGKLDRKAMKTLRNNFYGFLTNSKSKVYKDSNGDYILVNIKADSVKISPMNEMGRTLCDISFDWYEVGDSQSIQTLQDCGLLT